MSPKLRPAMCDALAVTWPRWRVARAKDDHATDHHPGFARTRRGNAANASGRPPAGKEVAGALLDQPGAWVTGGCSREAVVLITPRVMT